MKYLLSLTLFIFSSATLIAQELKDMSLLHTPAGIVLELNKDVIIPANRNSVNLYFIDASISFAELMLKEKRSEVIVLPKGYRLKAFRTELVRLKDYYGYATSAYVFFEDPLVDNIMFACPDLELTLNDLDNSENSKNYFSVDYSKASSSKMKIEKSKIQIDIDKGKL